MFVHIVMDSDNIDTSNVANYLYVVAPLVSGKLRWPSPVFVIGELQIELYVLTITGEQIALS